MSLDQHDHSPDGHSHDQHSHDGHAHTHEATGTTAGREQRLPPSGEGTVVLDIGDGIGALVVHTTSALAGVEIELARTGENVQFVHTEVRTRVLPDGEVYAGVFSELPEGDFVLLGVGEHDRREVTIRSGQVTQVDLSA